MATNGSGVLPSQTLHAIFEAGSITGIDKRFINPASIDLPLSDEAYRLEGIFLPRRGERVRELIPDMGGVRYDLANPLEKGVAYLIRIEGNFRLPENVYGYVNPKSSTGRINLFCRVVADKVAMYDAITPAGWHGEVWVLVRADSFPVLLAPGKAVSQLRLFDAKSFLDPLELNLAVQQHGILFHPSGERFADDEIAKHSDSLLLSLYVKKGQVGWECRGSSKVLDFSKDSHYQPSEFFEPLELSRDRIMLRRDTFYILTTYERVLVPPELSAELRAIDPRFGEFRSHAAGYIDPGWGWGESGEAGGRPITLEVTMHEDMVVSHRQTIARIRYEKMKAPPKVPYDKANSHYTTQVNARLSRHFRQ